jgi:glucosamine kinase
MPLYLGIDGGATKTTAVVASDDRLLGRSTGRGSNLNRRSEECVVSALRETVEDACRIAGVLPADIEYACAGLAGSGRPETAERLQRILGEIVPAGCHLVGDMAVAHASMFCGFPGIAVIAGSGSIAYGVTGSGEIVRAGGWGSAISDEGSGYWIGREGVRAVLRAADEGRRTALTELILDAWKVAAVPDLVRLANNSPAPDYAALFPVVQFASAVDREATEILTRAAAELARLASTLMRHFLSPVQVGITGGVFRHSSIVRRAFSGNLSVEEPSCKLRFSTREPVMGAIYLARKQAEGRNGR